MALSKFSQPELAYVSAIFAKADPQNKGLISGDEAVKVLAGASLPPTTLGLIWNLADDENNGFLTKKGVAVLVRLVGWAQKGEQVSPALVDKPGPLPTIAGLDLTAFTAPAPPQSPPPTSSLPPLSADDRTKYTRLFNSCGPTNGLLEATKARDVFLKSKLPLEKLTAIWNLADTRSRAALDVTDFIIGMYLIAGSMGSKPFTLPATLPTWLYQQASGSAAPVAAQSTGGSFGSPSVTTNFTGTTNQTPVQQQFTGSQYVLNPQATGSSLRPQPPAARVPPAIPARPSTVYHQPPPIPAVSPFPLAQQKPAVAPWDVTADEKQASDGFFATLDPQNRGFIEGDVAVPFLLRSNLPEEILAQVWDLADISKDGQLTRDTFAVAMHLINAQLAGQELPNVLPPSLIPPSLRGATSFASPAAVVAPPVQEPHRDLWEDSPPMAATVPANVPQPLPQALPPPQQPAFASSFSPPPVAAPPIPAQRTGPRYDFMSDDDEATPTSEALPDSSVEIGNLQNQINSTSQALGNSQKERGQLEVSAAATAATLSQLQSQLAVAKASFETESKLLGDLKERYNSQNAQIQATREQLITAESDLSALRVEKAEIEGTVLRDKEEVRDLQRKMKAAVDETEIAKKEIEKAKKDVRHQKGLVAIAKKQLANAESVRDKAAKELAEAHAEVEEAKEELAGTEAEIAAAEAATKEHAARSSPPIPAPVPLSVDAVFGLTSPALPFAEGITPPPRSMSTLSNSSGKSNNPFDKLMMASAMGGSGTSTPPAAAPAVLAAIPAAPAAEDEDSSDEEEDENDPFGLSVASPTAIEPSPAALIDATTNGDADADVNATPTIAPKSLDIASANKPSPTSLVSSDSPTFFTPPSTANLEGPSIPESMASITAEESKFPALTDDGELETDLPPLKEIVEEDSSDSDDDVPIGQLKKEKQASGSAPAPKPTSSNTFDDMFGLSSGPVAGPASGEPHASPILGTGILAHSLSNSSMNAAKTGATPLEPLTASEDHIPPPIIDTIIEPGPAPATVADFDEAFGRLPSPNDDQPAVPGAFKFNAFDDNFDFSGAGAFNPAPAAPAAPVVAAPGDLMAAFTPQVNGNGDAHPMANEPAAPAPKGFSFDDAFGGPVPAPAPAQTEPNPAGPPPAFGFDDAFGTTPQPQPQPQPQANGSANANGHASPPFPIPMTAVPSGFPPQSMYQPPSGPPPPTSPNRNGAPRSPVPTTGSSHRSSSPGPRPASPVRRAPSPSPNQRPASPKPKNKQLEAAAAAAAPPPRTSKLSLHFPWGKNKDKDKSKSSKKDKNAPAASSPHPHDDEAAGDVEGVQQLMAMGFPREQALFALEHNGYDVQLALNNLLAGQ